MNEVNKMLAYLPTIMLLFFYHWANCSPWMWIPSFFPCELWVRRSQHTIQMASKEFWRDEMVSGCFIGFHFMFLIDTQSYAAFLHTRTVLWSFIGECTKGRVHPIICPEGPVGSRGIVLFLLYPWHYMVLGVQCHPPVTSLAHTKIWFPECVAHSELLYLLRCLSPQE